MTMRLAVASLALALIAGLPGPAQAQDGQADATFCFRHDWACGGLEVTPPAAPTPEPSVKPRRNQPSVVYRVLPAYDWSLCWRNPDGTVHYLLPGEQPAAGVELGTVEYFVAFDLAGNRIPGGPTFDRCTLDPVLPPIPPPAPTPQEIWDQVPLPQPVVSVSPPSPGLVGMEAWFWSNVPDAPVSVQVQLGPWTATVTAEPDEYRWSADDTELGSADRPGDEDHPAVRHPFPRKGEVTITHTVVWSGTFTLTGPLTVGSQSLGTVEPSASAPYAIREIEAVIVG